MYVDYVYARTAHIVNDIKWNHDLSKWFFLFDADVKINNNDGRRKW